LDGRKVSTFSITIVAPHVTRRIGVANSVIRHIAVAIPSLRVIHARNDRIRLDKMVDIRRSRQFARRKKVVKVPFFSLLVYTKRSMLNHYFEFQDVKGLNIGRTGFVG
jgi:hypothetical protein